MFSFRKRPNDDPLTHIGTGVNMEHPTKIAPLSIPDSYRKRHMFVFGTTGVGKTRLCENLIEQDINKGYSVVYFDPKGDQQIFTKIFDVARSAGRLGNAAEIRFHDGTGPYLSQGARFRFTTFGFPVEAEVTEYEPPAAGRPARVAWHGWVEGDADSRLDVHHAWLIENLPGGRVRILTQETQIGKPAQELARTRPNPMLNAHQDWIDGLANAAVQQVHS